MIQEGKLFIKLYIIFFYFCKSKKHTRVARGSIQAAAEPFQTVLPQFFIPCFMPEAVKAAVQTGHTGVS